jgi:polyisoprenoid-binding protein YceI
MSWIPDFDETSLSFEARRLGVTTLRGRFDRFSVEFRPDTVAPSGWVFDLGIAVASIATGKDTRDARLTGDGVLQAERYPEIVFRTRSVEPLHDLENSLSRVSGDLTVRGVTREANWEFALVARAEGEAGEIGALYVGRLEFQPWKWGLGTSVPLVRQVVTITFRLLVLAADGGEVQRSQANAPEEIVDGATTERRTI